MKLIIFFSLLLTFYSNYCSAQDISTTDHYTDHFVISPFVGISELDSTQKFVRKYEPFDDVTLFASVFGIQLYNDNMRVNMFPVVMGSGNLDNYNPELGMAFLFNAFDSEMNELSIGGDEIIFLIDNKRKVMKLEDPSAVLIFEWSEFANLINAENVRARMSGENYSVELNWNSNIRQLIIPFLDAMTSSNEE